MLFLDDISEERNFSKTPLTPTYSLWIGKDLHEFRRGLNSRNRVVEKVFSWSFLVVSVVPVLMGLDSRYQVSAWHCGKSLRSASDSPKFKSQALISGEIFRRCFFICEFKIKISIQEGCVKMRLSKVCSSIWHGAGNKNTAVTMRV